MSEQWKQPTAEEMAARKAQWEREAREPTPLPWKVVYGLQWNDSDETVAIAGAPPMEDTVADNAEFYPHAIKAADAEFIVRAVNAHDALVAALEAAQKAIRELRTQGAPCAWWDDIESANLSALALARNGGSNV